MYKNKSRMPAVGSHVELKSEMLEKSLLLVDEALKHIIIMKKMNQFHE